MSKRLSKPRREAEKGTRGIGFYLIVSNRRFLSRQDGQTGLSGQATAVEGDGTTLPKGDQADETTVLLIEGDHRIRESLCSELTLAGFRVRSALDGVSGLKEVLSDTPDLIFLEVRLPSLAGLITLKQIRSDPATKDVPVVVFSSCPEAEMVKYGFSLDDLEYLVTNRPALGSLRLAV